MRQRRSAGRESLTVTTWAEPRQKLKAPSGAKDLRGRLSFALAGASICYQPLVFAIPSQFVAGDGRDMLSAGFVAPPFTGTPGGDDDPMPAGAGEGDGGGAIGLG
ncbi:MAG: hypothetical protein H0T45_08520, partial [Pyrinomonadaceae bacterium]|nr:hypothetical protein [Pyrinomonadaceae bacterium]